MAFNLEWIFYFAYKAIKNPIILLAYHFYFGYYRRRRPRSHRLLQLVSKKGPSGLQSPALVAGLSGPAGAAAAASPGINSTASLAGESKREGGHDSFGVKHVPQKPALAQRKKL